MSPEEESDIRAIERAIGHTLPRVTLPDFDYRARPKQLEVPLAERMAAMRAQRGQARARAQKKAASQGARPAVSRSNPHKPATARPLGSGRRYRPGRRRSS